MSRAGIHLHQTEERGNIKITFTSANTWTNSPDNFSLNPGVGSRNFEVLPYVAKHIQNHGHIQPPTEGGRNRYPKPVTDTAGKDGCTRSVFWSASSVVPYAVTPFKYMTRGRERSVRGGVRTREMTCVRWGSSHSIKHLAVTL